MSTATESKHTPGPWRISGAAEGAGITIEGKRNSLIAFVRDNQHPLTDVSEHEATANARLIAAAPAMLEALEALHVIIDFEEPVSATGRLGYVDDPSAINEAMRKAYAAIKLAKGE